MAFVISTYIKNELLTDSNLASLINGGVIDIYGAATSQAAANALIPASADAAIGSALLLCTVSNNGAGTGINMDTTPVAGILSKAPGETWVGDNVASGYPSFYRWRALSDTGAADTTNVLPRLQGSVGILGTDLVIASAYLTSGQEQRIDSYVIGLP